ncbi:MAG: hypothetical protein ACLFS9_04995 [Nitriliruptoraceae bacterium]
MSAEDAVAVRTLLVGGMPLLVASAPDVGRGPDLVAALRSAGLEALEAFLGRELPHGARVGFQLDPRELRLVDEREDALLRAPRSGLDAGWIEAALRLKGTMLVVLRGGHPDGDLEPRALAATIEERAHAGLALGAIIGVAEERPTLPMVF